MDLRKTTFAVLAKKKNSAAHKWFKDNVSHIMSWSNTNCYYIHIKKSEKHSSDWDIKDKKPKNMTIYTEEEFEMLLKKPKQQEQTNGFFNENFY